MISGLAGVLVWTAAERFEAMASFYADVVGLPVRTRKPGFVNFAWGDVRLTISVHSGVSGAAADPLRIMVNLATTDIAGDAGRLAAAGVVFQREASPEPWGGWIATFADPDGNLVQLLQPAP